MPGFDRTGPGGLGPRTGRGMGYCGTGVGAGAVGAYYGYGVGRGGIPWGCGLGRAWGGGRGRGFGGGFGRGQGLGAYYPVTTLSPDEERARLKQAMGRLQADIDAIRKRLEEIDSPED